MQRRTKEALLTSARIARELLRNEDVSVNSVCQAVGIHQKTLEKMSEYDGVPVPSRKGSKSLMKRLVEKALDLDLDTVFRIINLIRKAKGQETYAIAFNLTPESQLEDDREFNCESDDPLNDDGYEGDLEDIYDDDEEDDDEDEPHDVWLG